MKRGDLQADFEILGLTSEATLDDVERAFREQRSLWAERALATYGLAEGEEGDAHLGRIDEAHRRLIAALAAAETGYRPTPQASAAPALPLTAPPVPKATGNPATASPGELPPFDAEAPGSWLRGCREHLGLTLSELARRTRISSMYLEQIEQERFALLPARVYIRGYVLQYARELGASTPETVARAFLDRMSAEG